MKYLLEPNTKLRPMASAVSGYLEVPTIGQRSF